MARKQLAEVKSIKSLVATGHDPLHAAYLHGQNYLSVFGELASRLSEFETYRAVVARAEETYVPGWPPMSPVSVSFFTSWALLDLLLGETNDTICSCALEVGKVFGMSDELALTLEVMGESAMGSTNISAGTTALWVCATSSTAKLTRASSHRTMWGVQENSGMSGYCHP